MAIVTSTAIRPPQRVVLLPGESAEHVPGLDHVVGHAAERR